MDPSGRVAVVTGSGRGLRFAYARALAAVDASVVINDVDADAADAAVKQISELDVMVTNAGVLRDRVLWKMSDDDFDTVQHVHLRGTFTCVRAAAIRRREQGEDVRIIVAGSPAGQRGNFGRTNWAAAKAGIAAMARPWAMELANAGPTANTVIPNAATSSR